MKSKSRSENPLRTSSERAGHSATEEAGIAEDLAVVSLRGEKRFSHPWIFQKGIAKPNGKRPQNGSIVDIQDSEGMWVGRGIYNGHARIALRILTEREDERIDIEFFRRRIRAAVELRRTMLELDKVSNAWRVINSEGDGLSGLVVDKFDDLIVMEFFSSGMYRLKPVIQSVLVEFFPEARFYWFAEEHVQKQEAIDVRSPEIPKPMVIHEHGLKFQITPGGKHKTGFFVDQRDNRKFLSTLTPGKSVLDLCCNSGGFGVYARALGGATRVTGIDLDETAIALAQTNARLNKADNEYIHVDMFHWLRESNENKTKFDVVVLDPAKLTRTREEVDKALRKYTDMNRLAIQATAPGGILLTCSCTGLVPESDFLESIRRAAYQAKRDVQIFRVSGAAGDHPWNVQVQEGRYLKAVWARVN